MIVPTKDYSPITRANKAKYKANDSALTVADQANNLKKFDTQYGQLQLNKQQTAVSFGLGLAQGAASLLSAGAQLGSAIEQANQSNQQQVATQLSTKVIDSVSQIYESGIENRTITYGELENGKLGLKVDGSVTDQLAQLRDSITNDKTLDKTHKASVMAAMDNYVSNSQVKMSNSLYAQLAKDNDDAFKSNLSNMTDDTANAYSDSYISGGMRQVDLSGVDSVIDSNSMLTPQQKEYYRQTAYKKVESTMQSNAGQRIAKADGLSSAYSYIDGLDVKETWKSQLKSQAAAAYQDTLSSAAQYGKSYADDFFAQRDQQQQATQGSDRTPQDAVSVSGKTTISDTRYRFATSLANLSPDARKAAQDSFDKEQATYVAGKVSGLINGNLDRTPQEWTDIKSSFGKGGTNSDWFSGLGENIRTTEIGNVEKYRSGSEKIYGTVLKNTNEAAKKTVSLQISTLKSQWQSGTISGEEFTSGLYSAVQNAAGKTQDEETLLGIIDAGTEATKELSANTAPVWAKDLVGNAMDVIKQGVLSGLGAKKTSDLKPEDFKQYQEDVSFAQGQLLNLVYSANKGTLKESDLYDKAQQIVDAFNGKIIGNAEKGLSTSQNPLNELNRYGQQLSNLMYFDSQSGEAKFSSDTVKKYMGQLYSSIAEKYVAPVVGDLSSDVNSLWMQNAQGSLMPVYVGKYGNRYVVDPTNGLVYKQDGKGAFNILMSKIPEEPTAAPFGKSSNVPTWAMATSAFTGM